MGTTLRTMVSMFILLFVVSCTSIPTYNRHDYINSRALSCSSIPEKEKRVLIIWPGLHSDKAKESQLRNEYVCRGYFVIEINIPPNSISPEEIAAKVNSEVADLPTEDKKIYHLACSAGALVLISYLDSYKPENIESSAIVAAPFYGSETAEGYYGSFGFFSRLYYLRKLKDLGRRLLKTSKESFYNLYGKNFDSLLKQYRTLVVASPEDTIVKIYEAVPHDYKEVVYVKGDHSSVIYSKKTVEVVTLWFEQSDNK